MVFQLLTYRKQHSRNSIPQDTFDHDKGQKSATNHWRFTIFEFDVEHPVPHSQVLGASIFGKSLRGK